MKESTKIVIKEVAAVGLILSVGIGIGIFISSEEEYRPCFATVTDVFWESVAQEQFLTEEEAKGNTYLKIDAWKEPKFKKYCVLYDPEKPYLGWREETTKEFFNREFKDNE